MGRISRAVLRVAGGRSSEVLSQTTARAQREQLQRDGFAIFHDALGREQSAQLSAAFELPPQPQFAHAAAGILAAPAISRFAAAPSLTTIVREFLGSDVFPFRAFLFGTPHGAIWNADWHQDVSLPMCLLREDPGWGPWLVKAGIVHAHAPASALDRVLSLRLPLRSVSHQRAQWRVLPGTHLLGVLDDSELSRLVRERPAVACAIPEGGVLALKPLLVHAADEQASPVSSPVLVIDYATPALLAKGLALPS